MFKYWYHGRLWKARAKHALLLPELQLGYRVVSVSVSVSAYFRVIRLECNVASEVYS